VGLLQVCGEITSDGAIWCAFTFRRFVTFPVTKIVMTNQTTTSRPINTQANGPAALINKLASYGTPLNARYTTWENNEAPNHTKTAYQLIVDKVQSSLELVLSMVLS
jgi:hypothetical protein